MDDLAFLLILLAITCLLSGPAALILSIVALRRVNSAAGQSTKTAAPFVRPEPVVPIKPAAPPTPLVPPAPAGQPAIPAPQIVIEPPKEKTRDAVVSLEQRIGTWWVLIAGVITIFISAGFFLKFAYEHYWIGPWGRIGIVAVAGIVSLAVGEITRRRGYGIAAKGTTALGFAILYAADFTAYQFYELIGSVPAFATAIVITAATMTYAVALDDVVATFLAMLGGFVTPVIISKGENMPMPLFGYVLVLSTGIMLCAYWRKWRAINLLAFIGTFALYTGWFEKFFRLQLHAAGPPEQMTIALSWLGIFFGVYLVLPFVYGLANRVNARNDDVWLVVINASLTFYYLWTILFEQYRAALALCAAGLSAAHLAMMGPVFVRCREDNRLRQALLAIGLAFLTTAIPLYWRMNATTLGWTVEGAILVFIGIRYRSILTQLGAVTALGLACAKLVWQLPMHTDTFRLALNPTFGTWVFVSAILWLCHFLYRRNSRSLDDPANILAQLFYAAAAILLFAAFAMEWYWNCEYNVVTTTVLCPELFIKGMILILAAFILLFILRPVCPKGVLLRGLATTFAVAAAIFTIIAFPEIYSRSFKIFANIEFAAASVFIASLFVSAYLLNRRINEEPKGKFFTVGLSLLAVLVLWVVLSEEIYAYWRCRNIYVARVDNWEVIASMWMSVAWATYGSLLLVGGFWQKMKILRYIGLSVLGVLLIKVFVVDMSAVSTIYRIMAFLATGVTLVGVSYLYQFLRKRGFFDTALAKNQQNEKTPH